MNLIARFSDDVSLGDLGVVALALAGNSSMWMRRRKLSIEFVDDVTARKRLSIEFFLPRKEFFTQPRGRRSVVPRLGGPVFVPLMVFQKGQPTAIHITDAGGATVVALHTSEIVALVAEGFSRMLDEAGLDPTPGVFRELVGSIVGERDADRAERNLAAALEGRLSAIPVGGALHSLLKDCSSGLLMLVKVPYEPGAHHVFHVEWTQDYGWSSRGGGRLLAFRASLALADKELSFPMPDIGMTQSTHVEIVQPENCRLLTSVLRATQFDPEAGETVEMDRLRVVANTSRPNISIATLAPDRPADCRADHATVTVALRPRRSGALAAVLVTSILATILLWTTRARLGELDAESSSAVMLLLPALMAAFLVREGSGDDVAGRLLQGIRGFGLVVASLAVAAGVLIAVGNLTDRNGEANDGLQFVFFLLASASTVVSLVIVAGFVSTFRSTRKARATRNEDKRKAVPVQMDEAPGTA